MLAAALQAEVAAYIDQFAGVRDENGCRLVVRNGAAEPRTVLTTAGAVEVTAPRVNDKRTDPATGERMRFSSSGDFAPALGQFLGTGAGLSSSAIAKLTETWKAEAASFMARDLSGVDYVYLWVDGIHLGIRLEEDKLCLLVMIGVRADGRMELVALADGYRESAESWADLLRECARHGMSPRCWPSETGHWGSGARCAKCFRRPKPSAAGFTRSPTCLVRCQVRAPGCEEGPGGDLERRGQGPRPRGGEEVRGRLWREVPQGRRQDHRR